MRVRRIFVDHVAKPRRTLLHGQSWGGMVAARAAEMFPKSWEGILLTSAVVAGPAAVARFAADTDHRGRLAVPVLTAHGIGDATVFVEGSDTLRQRMVAAGNGDRLVQTFVDSSEHSYWGDAMSPPLFEALLNWVDKGQKPSPIGIADRCRQLRAAEPADCRFLPDYAPKPLAARILPR